MARGKGSWIWDTQGRRYLDLVQGWAVNALGHSHPATVNAICKQATRLTNCGPAFFNEPAARLCTRLASLCQLHGQAFLGSSGAEANEAAIKLVRKWAQQRRAGAFEIIATEGSFHGRTLATMAGSGKAGWDKMFPPSPAGFIKVPYGDLAAVPARSTPPRPPSSLNLYRGSRGCGAARRLPGRASEVG
jgi:acetylornithine/N-succinyldiaminopimelate aminotransferase